MTFRLASTLAAIVAAAAATCASGETSSVRLVGTVGPGFDIRLETAAGKRVTHLRQGTYTIVIHDRSSIHNVP